MLDAMEFLKKASLGEPVRLGRRVGVVGGGNAAVDAARVAARLRSQRRGAGPVPANPGGDARVSRRNRQP